MARNPQIVVEYVAKTAELKQSLDDASKSTNKFSDRLKGIAKGGALAAGAAGIGGLVFTLKTGISEWQESTKVAAQTQAVLKSTGKAAGVTATHVSDLAESLMKKSGVDDEAIASGENLLLTFTNIRNEVGKGNDVFDQTTKAALDMSVALGTDMKSAALQLGKALNDPVKGVTKLTRSGVTFTEAQKEQIKKLQESGKSLEAQKIILAEVRKEFGGSAAAAGKTLPGQLEILKQNFNNLAGELVAKLIPVLQDTIAWLRDHWPEISSALNTFWQTVQPILKSLWELLADVVAVIQKHWPQIEPILVSLGKQMRDMGQIISGVIKLVTDLLHGEWAEAWEDVKQITSAALDFVKERVWMFVEPVKNAAVALGKAILHGIEAGISGLIGFVRDRITAAKDAIVGLLESVYLAAFNFGAKILDGVTAGMVGLYTWVHDRVAGAVGAVDQFVESALKKGKDIGGAIKDGIDKGLSGVVALVETAIKGALNAIIDVWNKFKIPALRVKGRKVSPEINLPDIPRLAKGGLVTSPTVAMIGEAGPELVVPLSGGTSPAVEVRVFIGDTELKGLVRTEIVDANTGIARTLLAGAH